MTDRLTDLKTKPERLVIGLNCGTSLDGVDAALVRVSGAGLGSRLTLERYLVHPLPEVLRTRLLRMLELTSQDLCELNFDVAEVFAEAALAVAGDDAVDLVGSHGITIYHRPPRRLGERGATLQLGDLAVLAERTGAVSIGDFRTADMAAQGQGAPLMPYLDYVLFNQKPGTVLLNLGGIGNITFIGEGIEEVRAFDTGPANLPLNHVMRLLTGGRSEFDVDGRTAAGGRVDGLFLERLMALPYVHAAPPKTTGREDFGEAWTEKLLAANAHLKLVDILATLTAFAARAVKFACDHWLEGARVTRVLVSGGGAHNRTLMRHLSRDFDPVPVEPLPKDVCDLDAKEAVLFALLANDRLFGLPTNVPAATGAGWPVSLGKVVF